MSAATPTPNALALILDNKCAFCPVPLSPDPARPPTGSRACAPPAHSSLTSFNGAGGGCAGSARVCTPFSRRSTAPHGCRPTAPAAPSPRPRATPPRPKACTGVSGSSPCFTPKTLNKVCSCADIAALFAYLEYEGGLRKDNLPKNSKFTRESPRRPAPRLLPWAPVSPSPTRTFFPTRTSMPTHLHYTKTKRPAAC